MSLDDVINAAFESITGTVRSAATSIDATVSAALRDVIAAATTCDKTGLFNTLAYNRTAPTLMASLEQKYVLVVGDLNGFKALNAQHQQHGGDMALKHVGAILKEIAATCDAHAYHPSGDEFALLVPLRTIAAFTDLARDRLTRAAFKYGESEIAVGMSFGYALPGDDEEFLSVAARAEQACLLAKRVDGSTVEWTPEVAASAPINHRGRCKTCHTKFDCLIPRDANRDQLRCPNCHEPVSGG
ncbi:MAG: diguanylate cyclase [Proteobacteria bacterium]|nr:diguanylate cyclase [Pseudomonadota bacterium]